IKNLCEQLGQDFGRIFQTITADNGSEFAGLYENLLGTTDVYFARPYASYERGTKENQHKLIRRFIPKSKRLAEISTHTIKKIQLWMKNLPSKILGYRTAKEAFKSEIKLLTSADRKVFSITAKFTNAQVANLNSKFVNHFFY